MIANIQVQVVVTENTTDTLSITKQPVQQGAVITDHSYMEPTVFSSTMYFKDNLSISLSKIYQNLLDLQSSRVPFDIVTPKRIYSNMLMTTLGMTTDKHTENCLSITMSFQQIIIVSVSTVNVPKTQQKSPGKTQATQKAGNKSLLVNAKDAVVGIATGILK